MTIQKEIAVAVMGSVLSLPMVMPAQTYSEREHERAKAEQRASDHRHHTGAKIVGGSAVGGAVIGGLAGGPKGALIGAGVGAAGGAVANKAREHHDVKKRERRHEAYHR
ncbi:MAG TPA: hypothetical protein VII58_05090 [Acidobacteriaceae bacterium]